MKSLAQIERNTSGGWLNNAITIDTTFVLFFLGIEIAQSESVFALDTAFMAITLAMVMVLPYFLSDEGPLFRSWIFGRAVITVFAVVLGLIFRQALGTVLPPALGSLPMTLLVISAMISAYIQFYGFFKFRLAK